MHVPLPSSMPRRLPVYRAGIFSARVQVGDQRWHPAQSVSVNDVPGNPIPDGKALSK
jgi:hypothetical protein